MACSGAIGWKGAIKINGSTLPFLNADINRVTELYTPTLIGWGVDSKYRSEYNYVRSRSYVRGSFSTEVFNSGSYASAFAALVRACVNGTEISIDYSAGGGTGISIPDAGKCYVDSMTLNGNLTGIVNGSFNIIASDSDSGSASASHQFESAGLSDDHDPVPWYFTSVALSGSGEDSTINNNCTNWSITVNNAAQLIYALNGESTPVDIRLGTLVVTGTISYYSTSGSFPELQDGARLVIDCGSVSLSFPHLVFLNTGAPNGGPNAVVVRNLNFQCFGADSTKSVSIS